MILKDTTSKALKGDCVRSDADCLSDNSNNDDDNDLSFLSDILFVMQFKKAVKKNTLRLTQQLINESSLRGNLAEAHTDTDAVSLKPDNS